MPESQSNVNLASSGIYGNTGNIQTNLEPGIPKAVAMVPKGTIIPAANLVSPAALYTYIQTASAQGFIANTRATRWFAFVDLDDFKDETKAMASIDTGLNQLDITKFNTKYSFRSMAANNAMFIEYLQFDNSQGFYDCYIIDSLGQIWGRNDPNSLGGLASFSLQQIRVKDAIRATVKDINQYMLSFQFKNRIQFNDNIAVYNAGLDSDGIYGLQNAVAYDVTAVLATPLGITTSARTDMVITLKAGSGSLDLALLYQASLTQACFIMSDLTVPATITKTMTAGTLIAGGQVYNYLWFVFSAITATHVGQIALATPSAVNAIIPNFNAVTEIPSVGANGANAAVHTF